MELGNAGAGLAKRMSEVSTELEQLQREVVRCEENLTKLQEKLGGILRVESLKPSADKKTGKQLVPLAGEIRVMGSKIRDLGNAIADLQDRIEV